MSEYIIKVENLGKRYTIDHMGSESYTALRDVMTNKAKALISKVKGNSKGSKSSKESFLGIEGHQF
jgi:lipopolysaccharide transport system ATP-binding protein